MPSEQPKQAAILAAEFDSYRTEVMPRLAGPAQVLECRRAFMAGSMAAYKACVLDLQDMGDEAAIKQLADVYAELQAYTANQDGPPAPTQHPPKYACTSMTCHVCGFHTAECQRGHNGPQTS